MKTLTTFSLVMFATVANLTALPTVAAANPTARDMSQIALQLAQSKRYGEALQALESASPSAKQSYDLRFAKARILTWSGNLKQAKLEYDGLLRDYPKDPDVRVSAGYMELFHGRPDVAQAYFSTVLKHYPNYGDARTGLSRANKDITRLQKNLAAQNRARKSAALKTRNCPAGYVMHSGGYCLKTN